jgi:hypothetical protein
MAFGGMDDRLDDLEQLLAVLEKAAPPRLHGKRRDFRSLTRASLVSQLGGLP